MNQRPSEPESDTLSTELHAFSLQRYMNKTSYINIHLLDQELYYNPPWYHDRAIFIELLNKSYLTDNDILKLARIYIKYYHIHNRKTNELNRYFTYMLNRKNISNRINLFKKTKKIYFTALK